MVAVTYVSDLKLFKSMWKIMVKILYLWKQYSAGSGLTIEMVFIDSNVGIFTLHLNTFYKFRFLYLNMSKFRVFFYFVGCEDVLRRPN